MHGSHSFFFLFSIRNYFLRDLAHVPRNGRCQMNCLESNCADLFQSNCSINPAKRCSNYVWGSFREKCTWFVWKMLTLRDLNGVAMESNSYAELSITLFDIINRFKHTRNDCLWQTHIFTLNNCFRWFLCFAACKMYLKTMKIPR